jgi:hypothetical protein
MPPKRQPFRGPIAPDEFFAGIAFNAWLGDNTRPRMPEELDRDAARPREMVVTTFWLLGHITVWHDRTDSMRHGPAPFGRRQGVEASPAPGLIRAALAASREQRIRQRRLRRIYTWARHEAVAAGNQTIREQACLPPCHWCGELTSNFCSGRVIAPNGALAVECGWPICVVCEEDPALTVCRNCMHGVENPIVSEDTFAYGDSESDGDPGGVPVRARP